MDVAERKLVCDTLAKIVASCICDPGGDPDETHMWNAARAWKLLEKLQPDHPGLLDEWRAALSGDNMTGENYLRFPIGD